MCRQILQPHVSCCDCSAQRGNQNSNQTVNNDAAARRPVQRAKQKNGSQQIKRHPLHHAKWAWVLPFDVLQVISIA